MEEAGRPRDLYGVLAMLGLLIRFERVGEKKGGAGPNGPTSYPNESPK